MKRKFFLCLLLLAIGGLVQAQSLKSWTWDTYKMKFRIPDNMVVQESTSEKFQATNNSITIDIYPRKGDNLAYSAMKNAIVDWAQKTGLRYNYYNSSGNEQPIYLSNINGYWGCAIDGTKDGVPVSILLLVDPDFPDISFYVWLSYLDDYYRDAVEILKSFEPE